VKKKSPKLMLAKETLRSLEDGRLLEAQGAGGTIASCSCTVCDSACILCTN
jgi:hypothetical protein